MRSLLMKLALLFATVVTLFLVAEISLRMFAPLLTVGNIYWYEYDEDLGIRLKPGMHDFSTTDYQAEMRTNLSGTVNFQESFGDYDEMVFTIGDSYTQGTGLPSDASYPFQLDLMLNMDGDRYVKKYGVVNLGLAAYGADQALIALQRYAESVGRPDYILFFGCSNDHRDDQLFESGYRHRHLIAGNPHFEPFTELLQWLANEVQVAKRLKYALALLRHQDAPQDARNVAQLQAPKFDRLREIADDYNAVLIVGWTDLEGKDHGDYEWLRGWALANEVRFADWRPAVRSVVDAIPALPTGNSHSGGHHRTWVNKMIARAYAAQISPASINGSVPDSVADSVDQSASIRR